MKTHPTGARAKSHRRANRGCVGFYRFMNNFLRQEGISEHTAEQVVRRSRPEVLGQTVPQERVKQHASTAVVVSRVRCFFFYKKKLTTSPRALSADASDVFALDTMRPFRVPRLWAFLRSVRHCCMVECHLRIDQLCVTLLTLLSQASDPSGRAQKTKNLKLKTKKNQTNKPFFFKKKKKRKKERMSVRAWAWVCVVCGRVVCGWQWRWAWAWAWAWVWVWVWVDGCGWVGGGGVF